MSDNKYSKLIVSTDQSRTWQPMKDPKTELPDSGENMSDPDKPDMVNSPPHYTSHPSGLECIQVTEHLNYCIGNAIKYLWRVDDKGAALDDLRKARWYLDREIARREKAGDK